MSEPEADSSDNAGVRIPPPLIYIAGFGLALAANRVRPLRVATAGEPRRLAAIAAAALGLGLVASAFMSFRIAKTTPMPHRPSSALVTSGPFRWTRNPMYLSLALLQLGAALAVNNLWAILTIPVELLVVDRFVVSREERYLGRKFGEAYRSYCARVRRWV